MGEFLDVRKKQVVESLGNVAGDKAESKTEEPFKFNELFGDSADEYVVTNRYLPKSKQKDPLFTLNIDKTGLRLTTTTDKTDLVTKLVFETREIEVNNRMMPASFGSEFARKISRIVKLISEGQAVIYENI